MNKKIGRPPTPENQAKTILRGALFARKEVKPVDQAITDSGQSKSEWFRSAAIEKAKNRPIWVTSKWKAQELERQTIQFILTQPKFILDVVGTLKVRKNPKGKLTIDILGPEKLVKGRIFQNRYWVFQEYADKIKEHPNQQIARFILSV